VLSTTLQDLINTGAGQQQRRLATDLKRALVQLLDSSPSGPRGIKWADAIKKLEEQSSVSIDNAEFAEVVKTLEVSVAALFFLSSSDFFLPRESRADLLGVSYLRAVARGSPQGQRCEGSTCDQEAERLDLDLVDGFRKCSLFVLCLWVVGIGFISCNCMACLFSSNPDIRYLRRQGRK
jgi:hypothetical protein